MELIGPEVYSVKILAEGDARSYRIQCAKGTSKFSGLATSKLPKLYILASMDAPYTLVPLGNL